MCLRLIGIYVFNNMYLYTKLRAHLLDVSSHILDNKWHKYWIKSHKKLIGLHIHPLKGGQNGFE